MSGFVSGFVSSTATVATMGAPGGRAADVGAGGVGAAVTSTIATVILLAILPAATSVDTLAEVTLPLIFAGVAAVAYGALAAWRVAQRPPPEDVASGRAFDLKTAVILAITVSIVLVVAGVLNDALGRRGVTIGAAVAGFADSQSAAVSAASLVAAGEISAPDAAIPVLAALSSNTVSKAAVALLFGKRRYAMDVWVGLALVIGAAWGGFALQAAI